MDLFAELQLTFLDVVDEEIAVLRTDCHSAAFWLQCQVGKRVPFLYSACFHLKQYLEAVLWVSETHYLIIRATHVYLSYSLVHLFPINRCHCQLMSFQHVFLNKLLVFKIDLKHFLSLILTA